MSETPRCRCCGALARITHDRLTGVVATVCDTCGDTQGRGAKVPYSVRVHVLERSAANASQTRITRDADICTAYTSTGVPIDTLAAEHQLKPATVRRILVRYGIFTDRPRADRAFSR